MSDLFPRRKRTLEVDLGEMKNEGESLSRFLRSKLEVDVASGGNRVIVESEDLSRKELKRLVNKFVYRRHLMNEYWVALESNVVRINKFNRSEKDEKRKKGGTKPSTIKHGW